jgi:predicted nucleic acid-binding protein
MAYLLDANVFIEAANLYYQPSFCPAYWDWLVDAHRRGRVHSIERIARELATGEDDLSAWADGLADSFFLKDTAEVLAAYATVAEWTDAHPVYSQAAKNTFLDTADSFLVAHALAGGHTLVTRERPANSRHSVKIPDACQGVNAKWLSPFQMLQAERPRFVLG